MTCSLLSTDGQPDSPWRTWRASSPHLDLAAILPDVAANARLIAFVAILVSIVWTTVAIASLVEHDTSVLIVITPIMVAVTGYILGFKVSK